MDCHVTAKEMANYGLNHKSVINALGKLKKTKLVERKNGYYWNRKYWRARKRLT